MNDDIRKYIDIITESADANISKLISNIVSRESITKEDRYYLSKKINVPISKTITLTEIEIYPARGLSRTILAINGDLFFEGEITDSWHRKQVEDVVKDHIKPILMNLGFSEEASIVDVRARILNFYDNMISLSFRPATKLDNELSRAIRHKRSMDDFGDLDE